MKEINDNVESLTEQAEHLQQLVSEFDVRATQGVTDAGTSHGERGTAVSDGGSDQFS